jgi:Zn-finger protein
MALSDRDCRHGRQIGKCADCDIDHMEMAADAEARRVDELTALRKQDTALIRQLVDALGVATTPLAKDRQEVLMAITAASARLEGKP